MKRYLTAPLSKEEAKSLRAGDEVYISGTVYTARDAAHKRLFDLINEGKNLPFDPEGAVIYYVGPSPAIEGFAVGSAGPTTSSRMDKYTPALLEKGVTGLIGKGKRSKEVTDSIIKNSAVYFGAIGGAGALLSQAIVKSEIVCYEDLGTEAIRKLTVENFPVNVIIDSVGNDLYSIGQEAYLKFRDNNQQSNEISN